MKSTELREKLHSLYNELKNDQLTKPEIDAILKQIQDVKKQISTADRSELLTNVNNKQTRLRELAAIVWELEQPGEDITTNDGSFHKVKVKKYPKIAALNYCYAKFEAGHMVQLTLNGERFTMYKRVYAYQQPDKFERPENFAAFLELNSIMPEPLTIEQFEAIGEGLHQAKTELNQHIENYKAKIKALNYSALQYWGLVAQNDEHLYTYSAKNS